MKTKKFLKVLPITTLAMLFSLSYNALANETQTEKTTNETSAIVKIDNSKNETKEIKTEIDSANNQQKQVKKNTEETINTNINKDSDGDGILDKDEKPEDILKWNFSDRDALMFSTLSYLEDTYIKGILDENSPLLSTGEDSNRISMIHYELSPYWKIKQTYHYNNGFDAVVFENKSKDKNIQSDLTVLAIRGTDETKDLDDDLALFVGANPDQANSAESLIDALTLDPTNKNMYITGHSLGGYLTLRAHAYAEQKGYDFIKKSYTFNAPKVKGNLFNKNLQQTEILVNELTKNGKSVHYKTNNDNIIPLVGFVKEVVEVGATNGKHALKSFYEEKVNNSGYFSIGTRNDITGKNYSFNNMVVKKLNSSSKKTPTKKRVPIKTSNNKNKYRIAL